MKRLFTILLTLSVGIFVYASKTAVDGIYYDFNSFKKTATVTYQGSEYNTDYYSGVVTIPETVTYRNDEYQVTAIGNYAFANSTKLTKVNFAGNSVVTIGGSAFRNCPALTEVNIPLSVTKIGSYAFYACKSLTSIVIPESVETVDQGLFEYCTNLWSVDLSDKVEYLGDYTFQFCENLHDVKLPANLKAINNSLFSNCKNLAAISIPSKVLKIGEYAFRDCESLSKITFEGTSIAEIEKNAFINCVSLRTIKLPEGLTKVGLSAFSGCSQLQTIWLPSTLNSLAGLVFASCPMVSEIYSMAVNPPQIVISSSGVNNSFWGVDAETPVYVPCGSEEWYRNEWTCFTNIQSYDFSVFTLTLLPKQGNRAGYADFIHKPTCEDASYEIKAYPERGYVFVGWSDGVTENRRVLTLTEDKVLTALFERTEIATYTVTFKNGDEIFDAKDLEEGDPIVAPVGKPTMTCGVFVGWQYENGTLLGDNDRMPAEDIVLTAKFESKDVLTYKINYDVSQGSVNTTELSTPTCESLSLKLEVTPKEGCEFIGWSDQNTDNPRTIISQTNVELTALFKKVEDVPTTYYTVTLYKDNEKLKEYQVEEGSVLADFLADKRPAGNGCLEYSGDWELLGGGELPETVLKNLDININSTTGKYKIFYHVGEENQTETQPYETKELACGSFIIPIEKPTKEGYSFSGWTGFPENFIMPAKDVNIYGFFFPTGVVPTTYTVSFWAENKLISSLTLQAGAEITAPADPELECGGLQGWKYQDGTMFKTGDKMPAANITLTAVSDAEPIPGYKAVSANDAQGIVRVVTEPTCNDWTLVIKAIADQDYEFVEWSDGNKDNPRTVTLDKDETKNQFIANFAPAAKPDINKYNVIISVNDDAMGYVEKSVTFEAEPEQGYQFSKWQNGKTENPTTVELTDDNKNSRIIYIAEFESESQRNLLPVQFRRVSAEGGKINILGQENKTVDVYNEAGQLIYSGKARAGIKVPESGRYIISIDNRFALIEVK